MSDIAIQVENLSKRYRIGLADEQADTLFGALGKWVKAPLQNYRNLRSLSTFQHEEAQDIIWALRDVSFQVHHGEVLGIIGHNGAGKSTLLKVLSRITPPTRGSVLLTGRVASLLEVGTGFHPELTGRENVYLNGTILGMTRREIDHRFDEIVDFSGIETFIDTPVKRYSSGMRVRLAFSVAAHLEPEILLIDEVLSVGDTAFQRKSLGKMNEVAREGRTALFVSHNLRAISQLTHNCILLNQGKIQSYGPSSEVIMDYMDSLNTTVNEEGHVYLADKNRPEALRYSGAYLDRLQLLNQHGKQSGVFLESEPLTIECVIRTEETFNELQLGCTIAISNGPVPLFTIPSTQINGRFLPGEYVARLKLDPNPLRKGQYTLAFKLFADGTRRDTLSQILQFRIEPFLPVGDNPAYAHRWVDGPIRFDYPWEIEGRWNNGQG